MTNVKKETKYIVNDLQSDSLQFDSFLSYLKERNSVYTYVQSFSPDLTVYQIICRPLLFDSFCMSCWLSNTDML